MVCWFGESGLFLPDGSCWEWTGGAWRSWWGKRWCEKRMKVDSLFVLERVAQFLWYSKFESTAMAWSVTASMLVPGKCLWINCKGRLTRVTTISSLINYSQGKTLSFSEGKIMCLTHEDRFSNVHFLAGGWIGAALVFIQKLPMNPKQQNLDKFDNPLTPVEK